MLKKFLNLNVKDQLQILQAYAEEAQKDLRIAEKDIWVCWVLKQLFEMPECLKMAFKGGTSLSKVYNIIDRFSEDIDITLDYRQFKAFLDLGLNEEKTVPEQLGRSVRKRLEAGLKLEVKSYAEDVVAPYLRQLVTDLPRSELFEIKVDESGECLHFIFPSVVKENKHKYMLEYVLIEFGGRNIIDPNEQKVVKPYIADMFDSFEFPSSNITVLSPERTFWEKATLIHVECHRGVRESAERLSRHWFDLVAFWNHSIGQKAINNIDLLNDVVALKSTFFNASYAHYDQCLKGGVLLTPNQNSIALLAYDFDKMRDAKMLYNSTMTFDEMMSSVKEIEAKVNETIQDYLIKKQS
ncbi:nucleotidyl transferase AbiEii/AbiGii toxin family protein [Acinetobacter terrestris]|jgi:hypothetical protein|uniref:nucleotidyl transferase AbiEii/AbiGii toxin family protein n=1 Tax=Acinetobacter Taxon 24 TaxID=2839056 RepID=UPI000A343C46|nr:MULTISPECIES: nucleotidyl transferase AbiEii/AbiGii toxin family protein [Acinetobacter Taxon 24]OTG71062.1 nucleotidyl transferase [Acinetobacter terrae]TCB39908.1 nucleotidyl transferase AbiEii/AbiGii toxin family protein [Acinetobacter terrestris]